MKKLALLLAAMTAVSAVASAKEVVAAPVVAVEAACPELTADQEFAIYQKVKKNYKGFRATNFGMELEVESYSQDSNNDISALAFAGFAYRDDITLELQAAAFSAYDDDVDGEREFQSSNARMQLSLWKKLNPMGGYNHSIGTRWRSQADRERLYARYKYSTGMVSGWFDGMYTWKNTAAGDTYGIEAMPVILKYNGFGVGYYAYFEQGNTTEFENFKHQVRFYTPSYNFTDKFSVNAEYRLYLGEEGKDKNGDSVYGYNEDTDAAKVNMLILNWSYDYSEALNLYAYTGVEYGDWNFPERDGRTYTDIGVGFNYSF